MKDTEATLRCLLTKRDIARVLKEIAFFLLLNKANPYKARAYERAAQSLLTCPLDLQALSNKDVLVNVKGIGPATASVISELISSGASRVHRALQDRFPSSLMELRNVPGLRITQILRLHDQAGIRSVSDLQAACRENRLVSVRGIGPKLQDKIQRALGEYTRGLGYRLYADVLQEALTLERELKNMPDVRTAALAGTVRRKMEVINEYVFVIEVEDERSIGRLLKRIAAIPNVTDAERHKDAIVASSPMGMPMRIVVTSSEDFGWDYLEATGSSEHLGGLHKRFTRYGFNDGKAMRTHLKGKSEEAIYETIGLPFIPPELREGRGESEWSGNGWSLITDAHIRGVFHTHTDYSDGNASVAQMVSAARDRGYSYIGISDHSQSAFYANGLKEPRIRRQWGEIGAVQQQYPDIHIFKGIEADILPDGSMDYADELLAEFDFVIASVHSRFNLSETDQTQRICRALSHPYVTMLGHPTGRLLLSRPGYRVDLQRVIDTAAAHHKILEINGSRYRLDLDWRFVRIAKTQGVKFCINPDAHAVEEFVNTSLGVNVARKGGLEQSDVVNTGSLHEMQSTLQQTK